jgi:dTDP-6-deoxy-L-talose 4-dehydrogenase (NAD+)
MKALVTGATGFIGRHLIPVLKRRGVEIVATAIEENPASFPWLASADYIPFNLAAGGSKENLFDWFKRPDILIHLAWEGLPFYRESFHFEANLPRHYAFIKNLIGHGLTDVTVAGTCLEYGMREGCLTEDLPSSPDCAYALAKDTLRKFLQELRHTVPFILKWPRLFYLYGPGQNPRSLLAQLDRALDAHLPVFNMSMGDQERDYLPVETAAEKLAHIACNHTIEGVINCCSGHPVTIKDLVMQHLARRNRSIILNPGYYPYPDFEPMRFWGSTAKFDTIHYSPL